VIQGDVQDELYEIVITNFKVGTSWSSFLTPFRTYQRIPSISSRTERKYQPIDFSFC
jgi:hypothetical protein